jgi:hypothetical protein
MCMKKLSLVFVFIIFFSLGEVSAQQVYGCLLPSDSQTLYTKKIDGLLTTLINTLLGGSSLYDEDTYQAQSNSNCSYSFSNATTSCKVCPGGLKRGFLGAVIGCNGGFVNGYEGFFMIECDLDTLMPLFGLTMGAFAVFRLRTK